MDNESLEPSHETFTARSDIPAALDRLMGMTQRTLRVFDYDLSDCGFERPARIDLLRQFLRGSRNRRLLVVVHDTRYLDTRSPRMLDLWRQFPEAIEIRCTLPEAKSASDAFVLADERAYWHRHHRDHPAADLATDDGTKLRGLLQRFDQLWEASAPTSGPTTLGL